MLIKPIEALTLGIVLAVAGGIAVFALFLFSFGLVPKSGGSPAGQQAAGGTISCAGNTFKVNEKGSVSYASNTAADKKYKHGAPQDYEPLYQAAAKHYKLGPDGPNYLSAVHKVETEYGKNLNVSSAGAQGHMQFMKPTWESYGVDVNDRIRNPWDPEDAIFAAARYLHASGAPKDWRAGIRAYNSPDWYYQLVLNAKKGQAIKACA
jgi:transglycosylase-like protein with SLT domain